MNAPASSFPSHATHDVTNQPPPFGGHNAWTTDPILRGAVAREGGAWVEARAHTMGELVASERMQTLAYQANRFTPELKTHDRAGHRIDLVEYHPAYHELMSLAFGAGLHSLAWTVDREGAFVARAALNYLWNQGENGVACPVTMCFAGVQVLRNEPSLAVEWEPKIVAEDYDPRPIHIADKRAATVGMAMTEKQGGSDLRANSTRAQPAGEGAYLLTGHKWFCSAPMSDGFLTLACTDAGSTCLLVPRSLPDGTRNRFLIQRLKDKVGNRSNASSEIEYDGTWAHVVGVEGRGIATIIEMAHLTRFDIVVANAGMMRAGLAQALHHCEHRSAFGKRLVEQPLMQNVLADLALEWEAATLLALRLARAFDAGKEDERERQFARIVTPVAKYWVCKRINALAVEAMECLGGSGYVEESPLARLYREAPVNGIWEGSGNVISLDVLRSIAREPASVDAFFAELADAASDEPKLARVAEALRSELADTATLEVRARRVVEEMAVALQAALMVRHAPSAVAGAFIATRLEGDWGACFGTLPAGTDCAAILGRVRANG
ncbi:MAG: acyl-CoA dehydrogenase family protein [Betaproteobacteria bacterium]|jgi:putative acyl-CoA dehydrogenase|nr:acyl-CoA dehydrogenase family protein [Betaproteobacteria bacterium]